MKNKRELELYRPPGIIRKVKYLPNTEIESQLNEYVWNWIPSSKIYVRNLNKNNQQEEEVKKDRPALYVDPNKTKVELSDMQKKLQIPIKQEAGEWLNFYNWFFILHINNLLYFVIVFLYLSYVIFHFNYSRIFSSSSPINIKVLKRTKYSFKLKSQNKFFF